MISIFFISVTTTEPDTLYIIIMKKKTLKCLSELTLVPPFSK